MNTTDTMILIRSIRDLLALLEKHQEVMAQKDRKIREATEEIISLCERVDLQQKEIADLHEDLWHVKAELEKERQEVAALRKQNVDLAAKVTSTSSPATPAEGWDLPLSLSGRLLQTCPKVNSYPRNTGINTGPLPSLYWLPCGEARS